MRFCTKCQVSREDDQFTKKAWQCKECAKKRYRENVEYARNYANNYRVENRDKYLEYNREYIKIPEKRAKFLYRKAKIRAVKNGLRFEITLSKIEQALLEGKCQRTAIPFDFEPHPTFHFNPFAPTIDKIDPFGDYVDNNIQIVCNAYNFGKGQMSDAEYIKFCRTVVGVADERRNFML